MITAITFQKVEKALVSARQQAKSEMPNSDFVFVGADNENIFFNVVAKPTEINSQEVKNLKEKTRFAVISETNNNFIYKAEMQMSL